MQHWKKLGKIFEPDGQDEVMRTHAAVPFVKSIIGDEVTILFSSRDSNQRSRIFQLSYDIAEGMVKRIDKEPVLGNGALGCFDDSGVMGSCLVNDVGKIWMYYIGWNLGVTVPFRNSIGLAVSHDSGQSFERVGQGPIIDRNLKEPHFTASCCVIKDHEVFKIWYLSCTGWFETEDKKINHHYHIKYAESEDGISWRREGIVALDYKDEYEYAISVPRVLKDSEGKYRMWFSSRGGPTSCTYRIRYAESKDGIRWHRKDHLVNLDVSKTGWDSEMICYPYIFEHKDRTYMLYNGNGYGKTGFGLAVLEQ